MSAFGMSDAVREMKKTPGVYYVTSEKGMQLHIWCAVEVDSEGKVFQLNHEMERDGELNDEGWYEEANIVRTELPEGHYNEMDPAYDPMRWS